MGGKSIKNVQDITAAGTATANVLNSTGDTVVGAHIRVGGSAQVNGSINANNTVSAQNIQSRGETYTQNWFRTLNDGGIYFQKYGGGWYMKDANTITAYNGKNVQTTGGILSGYVKVSGNIEATGNIHSDKTIDANYFYLTRLRL